MKITVVGSSGGDWEGIYVDGKMKMQGHHLHWRDVLDVLGIKYEQFDADDEWMYEVGQLPDGLKEVVREGEVSVTCISTNDNADLVVGNTYRSLPDPEAKKAGLMRIVDDSGEDYLYPIKHFKAKRKKK